MNADSGSSKQRLAGPKEGWLPVFLIYLRLGLTSFGGPIAHLGYFREEFVSKRKWLSETQFSQLIAISQFLPGPASSQLGFSIGLLRAGWSGGVSAFLGFTLPSALLLVVFAAYLPLLDGPIGSAAIHGLKIVAVVVVAQAVRTMFGKICTDIPTKAIAIIGAAIVLLYPLPLVQLVIIACGGLAGIVVARNKAIRSLSIVHPGFGTRSGIVLLGVFGAGLVMMMFVGGAGPSLLSISSSFYQAGALVFGGGHVVLPLLEQFVVEPGWVTQTEFLSGYGAAQAIPGPMFSFSAYLGAMIMEGETSLIGGGVALLFIFLPGFLLMAGILPFWSQVIQFQWALRAVIGINAAVVGVLLATLVNPVMLTAIETPWDGLIGAIVFAMVLRWKAPPLLIVFACVTGSILVYVFV